MDWIINGQKYDVDFNFAMNENDSIMSRIQSSKTSLRNSTLPEYDGSGEVYGVSLTPNRWATYCKRKAQDWYDRNGNYRLAQLDSEIARLESLLESYKSAEIFTKPTTGKDVKEGEPSCPVKNAKMPTISVVTTPGKATDYLSNLYESQSALSKAKHNLDQLLGTKNAKEEDIKKAKDDVEEKQNAAAKAQKDLKDAQFADETAWGNMNEYNRMTSSGTGIADAKSWIPAKIKTIGEKLDRLKTLRSETAQKSSIVIPVISGVSAPEDMKDKHTPSGTGLAIQDSELAGPIFISPAGPAGGAGEEGGQPSSHNAEDADPWTTIIFSYSASDVTNHLKESERGMKIDSSVGFGLWSVGCSHPHDFYEAMQSDMATCDVSVSFSALVVNINRPWLYDEIFSDVDLEVADDVKLSPGPLKLHQMIKDQSAEDDTLGSQFPAYPTSFIVAADTIIEFRGSTKHIEDFFALQSNAGEGTVGYGPWSGSNSSHESATEPSMQVHSTATGCKVSFGALQIIAWVSQILPPLPRDQKLKQWLDKPFSWGSFREKV